MISPTKSAGLAAVVAALLGVSAAQAHAHHTSKPVPRVALPEQSAPPTRGGIASAASYSVPCLKQAPSRTPNASLGSGFTGLYRLGPDSSSPNPTTGPSNGPGPFAALGGVYAAILSCSPWVNTSTHTFAVSQWVMLQQFGNGNDHAQIGFEEYAKSTYGPHIFVELQDPNTNTCIGHNCYTYAKCAGPDPSINQPPLEILSGGLKCYMKVIDQRPPKGYYVYYTVLNQSGKFNFYVNLENPSTGQFTGAQLAASSPVVYTPNQANIDGETHVADDQMPGTADLPERAVSAHVFVSGSWQAFGGHQLYNNSQTVRGGQTAAWYGECASADGSTINTFDNLSQALGAPGGKLVDGQSLKSANGQYSLIMQNDGNLVLYGRTGALWSTGTVNHPGDYAIMQSDGNFVIYPSGGGTALWSTGTVGSLDDVLIVTNDGNVVIESATTCAPIWQSNPNTVLGNPSFETGTSDGWHLRISGMNGAVYNNPNYTKSGAYYFETNTGTVPVSNGPSVYQDVSTHPAVGARYTFSIWVRSPSTNDYSGVLALWGLGGTNEAASTPFTATYGAWTLATVTLVVSNPNHTALRVELYEHTPGANLDIDAARLVAR